VSLSAKGTTDPDGDALNFQWWQYREAGRDPYPGIVKIENAGKMDASLVIPPMPNRDRPSTSFVK
jgi:hypothetical protein